jgi:predicted component of type VI protein secretion system
MHERLHVTQSIKHGARLRYPIRDAHGLLRLSAGAEVTDRLFGLLQKRGISLTVWATLKVTRGWALNQEIPLHKDVLVVGRWPDCEVRLDDSSVSGRHCRIQRRPPGVYLAELGSRNGTCLNGLRVHGEVELGDQDDLRLGELTFSVGLFAELAAESAEGSEAITAWVLSAPADRARSASPYAPTDPFIDLDSLMS